MSKIGEKPIKIHEGIEVSLKHDAIHIRGKNGKLIIAIPDKIAVKIKDDFILVDRLSEYRKVKALHGLIRSLISNAIEGVTKLWEKHLKVVGTGYRVKMQGEDLHFELGFSHPVIFKKEDEIEFEVKGKNDICIKGCDKQRVGEVAYKIRSIRKPDAYKGKGIQYKGEILRLKPGKKAKTE